VPYAQLKLGLGYWPWDRVKRICNVAYAATCPIADIKAGTYYENKNYAKSTPTFCLLLDLALLEDRAFECVENLSSKATSTHLTLRIVKEPDRRQVLFSP
jgi:hypothetical protein